MDGNARANPEKRWDVRQVVGNRTAKKLLYLCKASYPKSGEYMNKEVNSNAENKNQSNLHMCTVSYQ